MIPIILHIPHASRDVPDLERSELLLDDDPLEQELLAMTDAWTEELVTISEHYDVSSIIAPVSRLVCDVERFRDDSEESMSRVGMGAVYTQTCTGETLRNPSEEARTRIIETYFDPHHALLTQAVDDALAQAGACLIIDIHSFPSTPLPYEHDQKPERPDVCIEFDAVHGQFLADNQWKRDCKWAGFAGNANRPFSGSIVPAKYMGNESVLSAMIEIRRDLYMEERTGAKNESFGAVSKKLNVLAVALASSATKYVAHAQRMRLPYEVRLPPPLPGNSSDLLEKVTAALGTELVGAASEQAEAYCLRVWSKAEVPVDKTTIPGSEKELHHYRKVKKSEFLANEIMQLLDEDGEVVDEYCWDGDGEATSPGSSFYACVKEWRHVYAWFSDVDSAGPFSTLEDAVAGMQDHCGVA